MAVLTTKHRNKLHASSFGLKGERKYPMPDKAHARNAKARASEMEHKGKLSMHSKEMIDKKADKILGEIHHHLKKHLHKAHKEMHHEMKEHHKEKMHHEKRARKEMGHENIKGESKKHTGYNIGPQNPKEHYKVVEGRRSSKGMAGPSGNMLKSRKK